MADAGALMRDPRRDQERQVDLALTERMEALVNWWLCKPSGFPPDPLLLRVRDLGNRKPVLGPSHHPGSVADAMICNPLYHWVTKGGFAVVR